MPELTIDGNRVTVPEGATVLEAARALGIAIPTLCHRDGFAPSTSCMVCVVKDVARGRLIPSCTAPATEGMDIESETDEVRAARRRALELLLSDHPADCLGPCETVCPAHLAIPRMIRAVLAGDVPAAAAIARSALVLPATLGRICPAPCEKACRRGRHDAPVAIRLLHRYAAEADLAAGDSALPERIPRGGQEIPRGGQEIPRGGQEIPRGGPPGPPRAGDSAARTGRAENETEPRRPKEDARRAETGKRVAVVGAGPAGLSAAWHLLRAGHAVTVLDEGDAAGGALRQAVDDDRLPPEVLEAEVALIQRLGAAFRLGTRVGRDVSLDDLAAEFDAVLIAAGSLERAGAEALGLPVGEMGLEVDGERLQTPRSGVFAAGGCVRPRKMAVRAVADGAAAAACIGGYLAGETVRAPGRPFTTRLGRPEPDELAEFLATASAAERVEPAGGPAAGFTPDEAAREARRCLHCDCRAADDCVLRTWSERYGAKPNRHPGPRRRVRIRDRHPAVVYEPGKCISCGLCVQVCERRRERLGLAFIGRGFNVRVGVPFDESIADGLADAARECAAVCPTGALALKEEA